jgi:hypothetical protein
MVKRVSNTDQNSRTLTNIPTPSAGGDAVNKTYADTKAPANNAMGVVVHGATAGTSRPTEYSQIVWIGSIEPTNASNNDIWYQTS